jgi:hypothetical protein
LKILPNLLFRKNLESLGCSWRGCSSSSAMSMW